MEGREERAERELGDMGRERERGGRQKENNRGSREETEVAKGET